VFFVVDYIFFFGCGFAALSSLRSNILSSLPFAPCALHLHVPFAFFAVKYSFLFALCALRFAFNTDP
jgi:hypothetical protein